MTSKRKRGAGRRLNDCQRLEIIEKLQGPKAPSKRSIASEYCINESAVRKLWQRRESVLKRSKSLSESSRALVFRDNQPRFPELEARLFSWIDKMRDSVLQLPQTLVRSKAKELAKTLDIPECDFKASHSWLSKFKFRKGLESVIAKGEAAVAVENTNHDFVNHTDKYNDTIDLDSLISASFEVMKNSYSRYSHFRVGAALLCQDGSIFTGTNVENASYSMTICAERSALLSAISQGHTSFKTIVVARLVHCSIDDLADFIYPCGACRQFIIEFGGDIEVVVTKPDRSYRMHSISELLPFAFSPQQLQSHSISADDDDK